MVPSSSGRDGTNVPEVQGAFGALGHAQGMVPAVVSPQSPRGGAKAASLVALDARAPTINTETEAV